MNKLQVNIISIRFSQKYKLKISLSIFSKIALENNTHSYFKNIAVDHSFNWHVCSEEIKENESAPNISQTYFPCKDMVNYAILKNHKYEIIVNPDREKSKNARVYICKYEGCGKSFTKTWNLVYHFRVHTNERPFVCDICKVAFSHKCNLSRHSKIHSD